MFINLLKKKKLEGILVTSISVMTERVAIRFDVIYPKLDKLKQNQNYTFLRM